MMRIAEPGLRSIARMRPLKRMMALAGNVVVLVAANERYDAGLMII